MFPASDTWTSNNQLVPTWIRSWIKAATESFLACVWLVCSSSQKSITLCTLQANDMGRKTKEGLCVWQREKERDERVVCMYYIQSHFSAFMFTSTNFNPLQMFYTTAPVCHACMSSWKKGRQIASSSSSMLCYQNLYTFFRHVYVT